MKSCPVERELGRLGGFISWLKASFETCILIGKS